MCYPSPQFPNAGPFADYGLESFAQVEPFTSGCQSDVGIFASPKLSVPNGYLQLHGMGGPRGLAGVFHLLCMRQFADCCID